MQMAYASLLPTGMTGHSHSTLGDKVQGGKGSCVPSNSTCLFLVVIPIAMHLVCKTAQHALMLQQHGTAKAP